jgi:hypothetical protein
LNLYVASGITKMGNAPARRVRRLSPFSAEASSIIEAKEHLENGFAPAYHQTPSRSTKSKRWSILIKRCNSI